MTTTADSSVRSKVYAELYSAMSLINRATGYNVDPLVCTSWSEATSAQEKFCLWFVIGQETFSEASLSGRQECGLEYQIYGLVKRDAGDIIQDANLLIQDVRNVLVRNRQRINDKTGAVFVGFDTLATDEGELDVVDRLVFVQPVVFHYIAGSSW